MKKFPIYFIKPYEKSSKILNVIVQTPKGSRVKYAYEADQGMYIVSKVLPEGMVFPYNFGFVPGTLAEDGDPIDMLILNAEPIVSNTLLRVRPVAVIKATQTEEKGGKALRNDRLIGQAISKESPLELRELTLEKQMIREIGVFFATYNRLYGKKFKVIGAAGAGKARELVEESIKRRHKKGNKD